MKNYYLILSLVAVLIVGGFGFYSLNKGNKSPGAMPKKEAAQQESFSSPKYIEYSKSALEGAKDKRQVLFFYANWCPICKPADADFKANVDKIPDDLALIRVNYSDSDTDQEEKDLADKYGVAYQHTFVQIDASGAEVTKWNGGQTDELLAKIK